VKQLQLAHRVFVERLDKRLPQAHGAVVGAPVPPAFQVVRAGNVPVGRLRGLVAAQPRVDRRAHAPHRLAEAHRLGQVVERIRPHHHERVYAAAAHVAYKLGKLLGERRVLLLAGVHQVDGRAGGAELLVEAHRQGVHCRRLRLAGQDEAALAGFLQVACQFLGEGALPPGEVRVASGNVPAACAHLRGERLGKGGHLRRPHRQAVVGLPARQRKAALYRVEATHLVLGTFETAPGGEGARVGDVVAPRGAEEIRVEAGDHVGAVEPVERARGPPGGLLEAHSLGVVALGSVLDPAQARVRLAQPPAHPRDGRRGGLLHENGQARIVALEPADLAQQFILRGVCAVVADGLGAPRIEEI